MDLMFFFSWFGKARFRKVRFCVSDQFKRTHFDFYVLLSKDVKFQNFQMLECPAIMRKLNCGGIWNRYSSHVPKKSKWISVFQNSLSIINKPKWWWSLEICFILSVPRFSLSFGFWPVGLSVTQENLSFVLECPQSVKN